MEVHSRWRKNVSARLSNVLIVVCALLFVLTYLFWRLIMMNRKIADMESKQTANEDFVRTIVRKEMYRRGGDVFLSSSNGGGTKEEGISYFRG